MIPVSYTHLDVYKRQGNHYEAAEVSGYGKMRLTAGINPQSFSWLLAPWENFAAPEAVTAYSCEGYNGMSQCMHAFVREHIVRGAFKHKVRPVLLHSWEAAYLSLIHIWKILLGTFEDIAKSKETAACEFLRTSQSGRSIWVHLKLKMCIRDRYRAVECRCRNAPTEVPFW